MPVLALHAGTNNWAGTRQCVGVVDVTPLATVRLLPLFGSTR